MRRTLAFSRQLGFDPVALLRSLKGFGRYIASLVTFLRYSGLSKTKLSPVLSDFQAPAGSADGHYFWQDLICARWINEQNPETHFDVGSRVDGFIAHLLSFREVIQLDIRENESKIPGLEILIGDAQTNLSSLGRKFPSISSLHSIEHFGLGRYGDNIDPNGHISGLRNIADLVEEGGILYISFPIGKYTVEFNAQRILDPLFPLALLEDFELIDFVLIPWKGQPTLNLSPHDVEKNLWGQAGLYRFKKR